ncbi:MAG: RNA binding S1 domain protein [Candidatus Kuenenbacteria bacterium GW2011_GWA2_42_15]|nr:MAG: RNA binding S1 domain protein [Candidatus Kuenenbacteria bacterium GW2011_GWA2_42_15]
MEKLLNSEENPVLPKTGDLIEGEVLFVGRNEIMVDVDGLLTGIIRGYEAYDESGEYSHLAMGDKISATVIDNENEKGLVELSLKQAGHKKAWDKIRKAKQEGEIVEVSVLDANKGGLMVRLDQTFGFLPVSQLSPEHYPRVIGGNKNKILEKLKTLINGKFKVRILDVNDDDGTLIVSERAVDMEERKKILAEYQKGDMVEGTITGVVDFGAFMEFGNGLEGLIHISELGWQRIDDPHDIVKEGQKIKAQIIDININKVSLSLKRLEKDPWEAIKDQYKIGDKTRAKVVKAHKLGAFVEIAPNIQGLARLGDKGQDDERAELEVGKEYEFVITNFEPVGHKLGLSLT